MIWLIGKNGMLARDIAVLLDKYDINYIATSRDVNISNIDLIYNFCNNIKPHFIINCAAYTQVDLAETEVEECFRINSLGVKNIVEIAGNNKAKLIHFSTDYIFDGLSDIPYIETDKTNPINIYGKSKLEGEKYASQLGSNNLTIRISWLYGIYGENFVYTMLKLMSQKSEIKVINDQRGSPTNTADVANLVLSIVKTNSDLSGVYHYTNNGNITWFDFAKEIYRNSLELKILKEECIINSCSTSEFPTIAKRPAYSVLSKEKIKNDYNISLLDYECSLYNFLKLYSAN